MQSAAPTTAPLMLILITGILLEVVFVIAASITQWGDFVRLADLIIIGRVAKHSIRLMFVLHVTVWEAVLQYKTLIANE